MDPCGICQVSTQNRRRFLVTQEWLLENPFLIDYIGPRVPANHVFGREDTYMCRPCFQRAQRASHNNQSEDQPVPVLASQPDGEITVPDYKRVASTPSHCLFPGCASGERLRIPDRIKIKVLCDYKIYIPDGARICQLHLRFDYWDTLIESPRLIDTFRSDYVSHVFGMVEKARDYSTHLNFENVDDMDPDELFFWTGMTIEQFHQILEETPTLRQNSKSPELALGIFLSKIRTSDSNTRLATLYHISRRKLERLLQKAADCLTTDFEPRYLGIDHISREEIVRRNLRIPDAIFGNPDAVNERRKSIFIFDGTYIYVQKSSNFLFQRNSYSLHKFKNLLKPFVITCSDGYILDVVGPYDAKTSDAKIMSKLLSQNSTFPWFFEQGDVFILDRGFRDSLPLIERWGYEPHMPPTKEATETQLSTTQANKSRLVTICRWVVEAINGRFKREFKIFRQTYFNRALPHMFQYFRIGAALLNAFRDSFDDNLLAEEILVEINSRINVPNLLADYVINNNINRHRASFASITVDILPLNDFPQWEENDLVIFALGIYQIKLARSYCSEHVRNGVYSIEIAREHTDFPVPDNCYLLRGRIQSRHTNARLYYVYTYIIVDPAADVRRQSVREHYCTCLTGKRTLGCCAHVMSIVWYLGWARHRYSIQLTAPFLDEIVIDDEELGDEEINELQ